MKISTMMAGIATMAVLSGCSSLGQPSRDSLVAAPATCGAKRFDIYFQESQATLTDAARSAIGLTATQLQGCRIQSVKVLGLASATGSIDTNLALSEQRAIAVAEALASHGWPAPAFELSAVGDAGAVTPSGVAEPLRRRTEVLIEATPQ